MKLNWRAATRAQLCEIAFNDKEAPLEHRLSASNELKRRRKVKHGRTNFKEKAAYPRG